MSDDKCHFKVIQHGLNIIDYWFLYHEGVFSSICKIFAIRKDKNYPRNEQKKESEVNKEPNAHLLFPSTFLKPVLKMG